MLNQNNIREKFQGLKGGLKSVWKKIYRKTDKINSKEESGNGQDIYEFTPDDKVSTSPRTKAILSNGSNAAQNLVWENEDASMQDKSYLFDEVTTDADYDYEDDLDFEDDSSLEGGESSRYR
jgi:hypothetical protein